METVPQLAPTLTGISSFPGFETPEQEAAFFFGLFLRGSSYEQLRRDIEVPEAVETKWRRTSARDPLFARVAGEMLAYRRRVLAIFQALVASESSDILQ